MILSFIFKMITIFQNLERQAYGGLENYPKTLLLLNSLLKKSKVKEVRDMYETSLSDDDMFESDITIILNPSVNGDYTTGNLDSTFRAKLSENGFSSLRSDHRKPRASNEDIKINIDVGGTMREFTIGYYFRERNTVIIPFNLFKYDWNSDSKYFLEIFNKILDSLEKLKPKKVDVKDAIENAKVEKFLVALKKSLETLKTNKNTHIREIQDYNKAIIDKNSNLETTDIQIKALNGLLKNKAGIITSKIKEIRELPFTKNVKLTKEGIMVDIGMVLMNYDKKRTKLGRYRLYLKSNEVRIYNLDAIKSGTKWFDHPHVVESKPCMGSWATKINKMLHALELKNLVLTIKLYLQSYNNDSPHMSWTTWCEKRTKQPMREKDKIPNGENPLDNRVYTTKLREDDKAKFGTSGSTGE